MCGITGWIDWERDLTRFRPTLAAMAATLADRGPDQMGDYVTNHAALGHRRLTVVDPIGGTQPMVRRLGDHTYVLVYNGELYNTEDLRQELLSRGHKFRGHSDTEVLLTAYIEWGPACVEKLNGIFAFGVWTEHDQRFFLARDRMGVKPLFYAHRGGALLFGSELKALLANPLVKPEIDDEGLAELFYLGPSRTPGHGVYRGVSELKPGHYLIHDRDGTRITRYWSLKSRPHRDSLATTVETVRELLLDAIRRQLVSDVPIATLLSGGLDSSVITAVAARSFAEEGRGPLHTWSIDYVDNDRHFQASAFQPNPDAPWIRRVSEHLGTVHHNIEIDTPELVASLREAVRGRDLPGMADVDSSLYLFCREIKKEVTVVLSGECADEIFGGYPWFHSEEALRGQSFPWIRMVRERARLISPTLGLTERIDPEAYVAQRYQETLDEIDKLPGEEPLEARRREMFYLNMAWFMANLLDRKDRMSMMASLEARVPFCDHRIVEYVWNVPWEMKMHGGREKGLVRKAMEGLLPDDVLYRKKSPYPKTHNPAYFRATRDWALQIIDDPSSPIHQLIDADEVRRLAQLDGSASGVPWFGQLMGLPQLFAWLGQVNTWLTEYKVNIV